LCARRRTKLSLRRPRYIYNQRACGRCKGPIRTWDMAARTVYCCVTCQPLRGEPPPRPAPYLAAEPSGTANDGHGADGEAVQPHAGQVRVAAGGAAKPAGVEDSTPARHGAGTLFPPTISSATELLTPSRRAAMASSRPARIFKSACAPDDPPAESNGKADRASNPATGNRKGSVESYQLQLQEDLGIDPAVLTVSQIKVLLQGRSVALCCSHFKCPGVARLMHGTLCCPAPHIRET
jgi:hypothetical protein